MKGFLRFDTEIDSLNFVNEMNTCLGLPSGETETWDIPQSYCESDPTSGSTQFWGYVVKVDTLQLDSCMTQAEKDAVIELPDNVKLCN